MCSSQFLQSMQLHQFGSVPLKTYLPDGDLDIAVFTLECSNSAEWATMVRNAFQEEQKWPTGPFKVQDIFVINAEVKIVKCFVDSIQELSLCF